MSALSITFFAILAKIAPLYALIVIGYAAGKLLGVKKEALATILIYIVAPFVVFQGVMTTKLTAGALSLPFLFFVLGAILCFVFYRLGRHLWKDATPNILGFAAGTGNTGYFGLPVALALFPPEMFGLAVLSALGFILFENSLGFYVTALGHYSPRQAFIKLARLPTLYAFLAGVLLNYLKVPLAGPVADAMQNFRGAYVVLGMMIVGLGIADLSRGKFDYKFIFISFAAKFIAWPLAIAGIILADKAWFGFYDADIYRILILMAIVPLAANTVTFAAELKAEPEKAAIAVFLSTIFSLAFIPLAVSLFIK